MAAGSDLQRPLLIDLSTVLVNDFFLVACLEDFIENARLFIFETFCRIHQCISISMLADKLNMTPEEAERWIVIEKTKNTKLGGSGLRLLLKPKPAPEDDDDSSHDLKTLFCWFYEFFIIVIIIFIIVIIIM
ncbi:hypothetical protein INR49_009297 [Caranx melampygus]|nr:hypothetical protein INR49_009297 [Caranx melampygus]